MILQLWAAGGATVLAVRDRFDAVAGAYIAGAGAGLLTYLVSSGAAGELSLGYSMLAMAVVTCTLMLIAVRRSRPAEAAAPVRPLRIRLLIADAGLILGRTSIYLAFNALYLVTLALTTSYAPGDATVLSYAYLFASYLVAGTAFALGMSRIADMSRDVRTDELKAVGGTVPQGFRYSILICAPALAAFVAAGAPIIGVALLRQLRLGRRPDPAGVRGAAGDLDRRRAARQPAAAGDVRARAGAVHQPPHPGAARRPRRRLAARRGALRSGRGRRRRLRRAAALRRDDAAGRSADDRRPPGPRDQPRRPSLPASRRRLLRPRRRDSVRRWTAP